jgi:predicted heme/steroid binding protein
VLVDFLVRTQLQHRRQTLRFPLSETPQQLQAMADRELRNRTKASKTESPTAVPNATSKARKEDGGFPIADICRMLVALIVIIATASYFITGTALWTQAIPRELTLQYIKSFLSGPVSLTIEELAAFDGTDPDKPLYLGLNGSIYDVSAGRSHYGPGGGYSFFGGHDGTRAFVTGCFQEDITGDLRGVEDMYMPIEDDAEGDKALTKGQIKIRREKERRDAKKKVREGVEHWEKFFGNSQKYFKVGTIKREPGWEENEPIRPLCKQAVEAKPKRSRLNLVAEKDKLMGHDPRFRGDPRGNLKVGVPQ